MAMTSQHALLPVSPRLGESSGAFATDIVDGVPHEVLEKIKPYVLDTLAVMVAGSTADSSKVMLAAAKRFATHQSSATVAGVGRCVDPSHAALLNGAFAHALELDD